MTGTVYEVKVDKFGFHVLRNPSSLQYYNLSFSSLPPLDNMPNIPAITNCNRTICPDIKVDEIKKFKCIISINELEVVHSLKYSTGSVSSSLNISMNTLRVSKNLF